MKKLLIASLVTSALASGCAVQDMRDISKGIDDDAVVASAKNQEVGRRVINPQVREEDSIWMPTKRIAKKELAREVDPVLKQTITVNRTFYGISDIAERFTILTGIPVQVNSDALALPAGQAMGTTMGGMPNASMPIGGAMPQAGGMPPVAGGLPNIGMPSMPGANNNSMMNAYMAMQPGVASGANANVFSMSYSGSRDGFLDAAAARYGVSWRHRGGKVEFYRYETRTFYITAVPGNTSSTSSVTSSAGTSSASGSGNGSGSGSAGGEAGSINTVTKAELDVWEAHRLSLKAMSTTDRIAVNPSTSSIVVTDTPAALAAMEKYVNEINVHMNKQVVVNMRVLSVSLANTNTYGINWSAVYAGLSDGLTYRFLSGSPTPSGVSSMTAVLGNRGNGTTPPGAGTQAILQALSTQGNVSTVTSGTAITLNNQSAPIQVARQTNYVQSTSTTTTANVGATTTITPGVLNTGMFMSVLPNIQRDGKLLMEYNIDLSSLQKMAVFTSGTSSVQLPDVNNTKFLQRVSMRSGETIVMSGFEQTQSNTNNEGIGDPRNLATGGLASANKQKSTIVILISAHVVEKI